jgi:hypothetical protein
MRANVLRLCLALVSFLVVGTRSHAISVFINEFHYDNSGTDAGEFIEIAGPAGTSLSGYSLLLYNGANGTIYDTTLLSGIIGNQQNGFGTLRFWYSADGIQNGSPDGIALVNPSDMLLQFLSYEGAFTGVGGPANGVVSTNVGVAESGTTPLGFSLQLIGTGNQYEDYAWQAAQNDSPGEINGGQTFISVPGVPESGATILLFGLTLVPVAGAAAAWRRRKIDEGRKAEGGTLTAVWF